MYACLLWWPSVLRWPFPPGVFIGFLAVAAALAAFRKKPGRWETASWILVFCSLMIGELWMISKDRDRNNAEQKMARDLSETHFKAIGDGIQASIEKNQTHFDDTMAQFAAQTTSLARLDQENREFAQKLPDAVLSEASRNELVEDAHDAAQRMRACLNAYRGKNQDIGLDYHAGMTENYRSTQKVRDDLTRRNEKVLMHFRNDYAMSAKGIVSTANRIRKQLLSRLFPQNHRVWDTTRAAWFENPIFDQGNLFLSKLAENADYLDELANRLSFQQ